MATVSNDKILGMTRKQAVMIGTLGAVLVSVLIFGQDDNGSTSLTTAESSRPASRRRAATTETTVAVTKWPNVSLEQMLQNNPFASRNTPTAETVAANQAAQIAAAQATEAASADEQKPIVSERREKAEAFLTELRTQRVKMILRSGDKVSAMIGERLIHEGEVIDGVRIVSILPTAVLAEVTQLD